MRRNSGCPTIERWIVISVVGALAACAVSPAIEARWSANVALDQANLRHQYEWLLTYRFKMARLPEAGGSRFVLTSWTSGIVEHTVENLDRFFTPGSREQDPSYLAFRAQVLKGEDPFPSLNEVDSSCTHYAGRRAPQTGRRGETSRDDEAGQAWMANDNEGVWRLANGTVNILMNNGAVRSYSYAELVEKCGLPPLDEALPIATWGVNSPLDECRGLDI